MPLFKGRPGCYGHKEYTGVGGDTSCIRLLFDTGRLHILEAGTGLRELGNDIMKSHTYQYDNIFIGLFHTHIGTTSRVSPFLTRI
jgi:hypothetical protein